MYIIEKGTEALIGQSIMTVLEDASESANVEKMKMDNFDKKLFRKGNLSLDDQGEYAVLTDFMNHLVFVFKNNKVIAFFPVYDVMHVELKTKRNLVLATGHETIHHYWLDDGEYEREYTR